MSATVKNIKNEPALEEIEGRIEERGRAWLENGRDMIVIHDLKLYREQYKTWEAYCEERWGRKRTYAHYILTAVGLADKLFTIVNVLPATESHVRPLFRLDKDEHRIDVWRDVVEKYNPIRAKDVEAEVEKKLAALAKNWITLDEWEAMDAEQREYALTSRSSDASLNKQDNTSIEWAQWSWNPVTGCKHDCSYCYARDIAARLYPQGFEPSLHPSRLSAPANQKTPERSKTDIAHKNIFAGSMADLFGRWVPKEWINAVFNSVRAAPDWNFLFLTKFPKRMVEFDYPGNAWLGTTVDCQARVKVAEDAFENVRSGTKWLSIEPMLEPLKFERLHLFDWIVIGGASSSTLTPSWVPPLDWVVDLWVQAREAGCAIYVKDNCGMANDLRVREFPWEPPAVKVLPDAFKYLPSIK